MVNLLVDKNIVIVISIISIMLLIIICRYEQNFIKEQNLAKRINGKFKCKYIILIELLFLLLLSILFMIIQFISPIICIYLMISILWGFLIAFFLIRRYEKIDLTLEIPEKKSINEFLLFFSKENMSYFRYTEIITWFAMWIHQYAKSNISDEETCELISKLNLILRPYENRLCLAIYHKKEFINLCIELSKEKDFKEKQKDILSSFDRMELNKPEEYRYFNSLILEKSILVYILIIIFHIVAAILVSGQDIKNIIGNLFFYLPGDVLLILIYTGIIKDRR